MYPYRNPVIASVYFIFDVTSGYIKIGRTTGSVAQRLRQMQAYNPNPMRVIGVHADADEIEIHHRFAKSRVGFEWFRDSPELRAFIAANDVPALRRVPRRRRCAVCKRLPELNTARCTHYAVLKTA